MVLTSKPCFYCQLPLGKTGIGLDRIDNARGYVDGNVLPCCTLCNYVRYINFSVVEMQNLGIEIRKIIEARGKLAGRDLNPHEPCEGLPLIRQGL